MTHPNQRFKLDLLLDQLKNVPQAKFRLPAKIYPRESAQRFSPGELDLVRPETKEWLVKHQLRVRVDTHHIILEDARTPEKAPLFKGLISRAAKHPLITTALLVATIAYFPGVFLMLPVALMAILILSHDDKPHHLYVPDYALGDRLLLATAECAADVARSNAERTTSPANDELFARLQQVEPKGLVLPLAIADWSDECDLSQEQSDWLVQHGLRAEVVGAGTKLLVTSSDPGRREDEMTRVWTDLREVERDA